MTRKCPGCGAELADIAGVWTRMRQTNGVITALATNRMIELGIIEDCKMPAFLDRASLGFSAELKTRVGTVVYDNDPPATYADWIAILSRMMSGIGKPV